eukprot:1179065-Prorocentrum_minimum.AAC.4
MLAAVSTSTRLVSAHHDAGGGAHVYELAVGGSGFWALEISVRCGASGGVPVPKLVVRAFRAGAHRGAGGGVHIDDHLAVEQRDVVARPAVLGVSIGEAHLHAAELELAVDEVHAVHHQQQHVAGAVRLPRHMSRQSRQSTQSTAFHVTWYGRDSNSCAADSQHSQHSQNSRHSHAVHVDVDAVSCTWTRTSEHATTTTTLRTTTMGCYGIRHDSHALKQSDTHSVARARAASLLALAPSLSTPRTNGSCVTSPAQIIERLSQPAEYV